MRIAQDYEQRGRGINPSVRIESSRQRGAERQGFDGKLDPDAAQCQREAATGAKSDANQGLEKAGCGSEEIWMD